jgi:DNA-binding response OmpR family regulator
LVPSPSIKDLTLENDLKILIVEDDAPLGRALVAAFGQAGLQVEWSATKRDGEIMLQTEAFDAVVLDLGLPDGSGLDLLAWMRHKENGTPVIILTARDAVEDRVRGLDSGADDYLVKPFAVPELVSRLRALIRRSAGYSCAEWRVGDVRLQPETRMVTLRGDVVALSNREFQVLMQLMRHPGSVVTRNVLEEVMAGDGELVESNALEVYVHHLRRKLGTDFIRTIRGVGYMVK